MVERLGNVLYALGCLAAGAVIAIWLLMIWQVPDMREGLVSIFVAGLAIALRLVGKAYRYVLAGRF